MDASYKHPVVAVVGPTATGKTALGVSLAQHFSGEVISCDSMQIYKGLDVGTAKVTPEETCGVMPSIPASKTNVREAMAKGTDRFMIETDYIDDPAKPGAIMSVTTVPKRVKAWLANGEVPVESIHRICGDIPESMYGR